MSNVRLLERSRRQVDEGHGVDGGRGRVDNWHEAMVLIASVHPLRFGACPAEPSMIECGDATVDDLSLDEALSARCNCF